MLSRAIVEQGIYPAVDPLDSFSRALQPGIVSDEHYETDARPGGPPAVPRPPGHRPSSGWTSSDEDKLVVQRARKIQRFLSQPNFVAEQFTGTPGKYVKLEDTIDGFRQILDGKHDDLPEQAFYMVGTIDEAVQEGRELSGEEAEEPRAEAEEEEAPEAEAEAAEPVGLCTSQQCTRVSRPRSRGARIHPPPCQG